MQFMKRCGEGAMQIQDGKLGNVKGTTIWLGD